MRIILICSMLFFLSGCLLTASPTAIEENIDDISRLAVSPHEVSEESQNQSTVWDILADKFNNDTIIYIDSPLEFQIDLPQEQDNFNLYLEGLQYPNFFVNWYASNKIAAFSDHEEKKRAIVALQDLLKSSDSNVVSSALFALQIFERQFNDPAFIRSPDGKNVAFHLFHEARYNDGEVWIFDGDKDVIYPLPSNWLSVERLVWSPDSKKIAIEYGGRTWGDTGLIDATTGESWLGMRVFEIVQTSQLYKAADQQRPDPYSRLIEWSPDGSKAMFSFSYTDDDYIDHYVIAVYDLIKSAYEAVWEESPCDSSDLLAKSSDYKW